MSFPAGYPGRGAWSWYNVTRSAQFWPDLSSVSIKQESPTSLSVLDCRVPLVGDNAGQVFDVEDECYATFRGTRIWAGHLKSTVEAPLSDVGPAALLLSGQDYTAKLDDAIVRYRKKRKRERVRRRVRWLLGYMRPSIWTLAGRDLTQLPESNPYVEAYDYYGMSVREALDHVADELRLFFFVDYDDVFHIFRTDAETAPFGLDNEAPDYDATFPFREWEHERDSTDMGNAYLVEPEKRSAARWSKDSTSITAYARQERFVSDVALKGAQAALNVGGRLLAEDAEPVERTRALVWEPGLRPGMKLALREALYDHTWTDRIVESVEITAPDPHDSDGTAYMRSLVVLTEKRRKVVRRKTPSGRGTADTDRYLLTRFPDVVPAPTLTDGATLHFDYAGEVTYRREAGQDQTKVTGPSWRDNTSWALRWVGSYIGPWYHGWTRRPTWVSGCPGWLDNVWSGALHTEVWLRALMPAIPADAAGVQVTLPINESGGHQGPSYGSIAPVDIMALDHQPDDLQQGTKLGSGLPGDDVTVFIPVDIMPAEGEYLYLGFRPSWVCSGLANPYAFVCGWTWPYMCNEYDTDGAGEAWAGRSGRTGVAGDVGGYDGTWKTWDSGAPDLGDLAELEATAPWQGGNAWHDAGSEGVGDGWSMDGTQMAVGGDAPAGKGLYTVGSYEDDDEPAGPWSDVGWAHIIHFTVSAHGSTTDAGTRHIQSTTTGQGEQAIGTVHLGDASRDEGISVSGPGTTDYAEKALTVDVPMRAMFDTRSGKYVRGKLWVASDGMPAAWDVQVELDETEDDMDRWMLWLRGGNDGTDHYVRVQKVEGIEGANSGQRVVKELIGRASGSHKTFKTAHPFRPGSLRVYVNGHAVASESRDGSESSFQLDFWPTSGSIMRATYIVE